VGVWDNEARLTPTFSFEVPVASQKMGGEAILPVSAIFLLNFGTVQIVCYILFITIQIVCYILFRTVQIVCYILFFILVFYC